MNFAYTAGFLSLLSEFQRGKVNGLEIYLDRNEQIAAKAVSSSEQIDSDQSSATLPVVNQAESRFYLFRFKVSILRGLGEPFHFRYNSIYISIEGDVFLIRKPSFCVPKVANHLLQCQEESIGSHWRSWHFCFKEAAADWKFDGERAKTKATGERQHPKDCSLPQTAVGYPVIST